MARSSRRKRRLVFRRKRALDPDLFIDYKDADLLKRFITDRGKIIPRRISGATAKQQREICKSIKRARYLGLLPFSVAHRSERGFSAEMAAIGAATTRWAPPSATDRERGDRGDRGSRPPRGDRPSRDDASASPAAAPAGDAPKATEE